MMHVNKKNGSLLLEVGGLLRRPEEQERFVAHVRELCLGIMSASIQLHEMALMLQVFAYCSVFYVPHLYDRFEPLLLTALCASALPIAGWPLVSSQ
ncbi:hypothetical protein PNOK_0030900 [Pyrrhoderma noxium]|uniref:Uncharacterized protein n=1 Tax=Pyrrhoderma noxium TaxID=2282107 RepID=A0A286UUI8_9AGAM|nr:hypothetical protein PNOK_0030900 [Pyrrhoderma noxium]